MNSNQKEFHQQTQENTPAQSVRVFSMPERYRHGAHSAMVEPMKSTPVVSSPVAPPLAPPKPLPPPLVSPSLNKGGVRGGSGSHTHALLIAGVIVLIALGIGGYLLIRSSQKATVSVSEPSSSVSTSREQEPTATQTETTQLPPQIESQTESTPFPSAITPGVDTDSDGLTNTEEELVYGTNASLPDTDGDGFLDGNEVFHRYNPAATGTLMSADLVQIFNTEFFQLLYPSKWIVLPGTVAETSTWEIAASTGEKIVIVFISKPQEQSLSDWYAFVVKEGTPTASKTKNGFSDLIAQNQLTAYVDVGTAVVTLTYNTGIKPTIDYLQTFQMMLNSLELGR